MPRLVKLKKPFSTPPIFLKAKRQQCFMHIVNSTSSVHSTIPPFQIQLLSLTSPLEYKLRVATVAEPPYLAFLKRAYVPSISEGNIKSGLWEDPSCAGCASVLIAQRKPDVSDGEYLNKLTFYYVSFKLYYHMNENISFHVCCYPN